MGLSASSTSGVMGKHGEEEERLGFTYDVFISFRGEDTRYNFIGHLRRELGRKGIKSFNDDRHMRIGESLSPALSKAIEGSRILIVVFSENYASSTWCLDELVRIIERSKMKEKKQLVFPVFYHVDPSDIRHQRNSFGIHMKAHENEIGKESQRMQAWRSALSQAVDFPGNHISTGDDEGFCIERIVGKVHEYITPKPLYSGQNPVGLEACIEEVVSLLDMKPKDKTVRMLGIYGLGGIGKTELVKALYDKIVQHFDAASFLSDVREKSNRINGIEDLQKTLLSEMLEELETELGSTSKGMREIEQKLKKKKVLLVLDDVGDKDELEKLAGGCHWFGSDYAKGLPLALKVIGSDLATLHEESLEDWEMAMEDYEKTPNKKIQDVKEGVRGIEVVMPFTTEIPEWFNYVGVQRNPRFWVRCKFPNIALAMIFHFQDESERDKFARRRLVDLRLLINGRYVPCKGCRKFRIEAEHILIFDLRVLFSDKEWLGLDALLEEEWNLVQIAYKATSSFVISGWGAFVYEDETKMDDLLFTSPDPVYSDEMPLAIVPTKDDMEEYKMIIESLGLDKSFKKTLKEWLDNKERGAFEGMAEDHSMQIVLGELKRISQDAEDALKSIGSALKDPKSKLRRILDELKNDDGKPKVTIIGDLALIRLKDPVKLHNVEEASTSGHTGSEQEEDYDPQLEEIVREIFDEGMADGLLEAQNRFPSLDIVETIRAALEKGYRVRWTPEAKMQTSIETRTYMSGIYSGLLEAKLRFPDLDMWATTNTVAKRKGITQTFGSPTEAKPRFPQMDWTTGTPPHDPLMQIFMMMKQQSTLEPEVKSKLFRKLKEEHQGLRDKFAQLEKENENENAAQNRTSSGKNQYDKIVGNRQEKLDGVAKYEKVSVVLKGRGEELGRLYDVGVERFQESEEFEDVMSAIYLNGLRGGVLEARAILLALHRDRKTDERVTNNLMIVKEAPTSSHKESEEEEAIRRELWYEGMTDGVLEAQNRFPSLDIADTFSIALGKGSGIQWTPKGMEIIPSAENRTYLSGVYGGILEAKLRFPDLDVWETLNTVANRRGINTTFISPLEPKQRIPHLDWTTVTLPPSHDPLMQIFMMMNQQGMSESEVKSKLFSQMKEENQVLGNRLSQLGNENENAAQNTASSSKNQYDELIQKFNIQYVEFVGKRQDNLDHAAEYEKVSGVLKGRGEELERLLNGVVERLLKLKDFEDLMSAIYLNGLRDGILEARVILLALRTDTN
ncbi:hypothetical protein VNO80_06198 [Phaseolus coccineus]|uniref:TIR domain-containing protein n=1 Tax=Phaseolus coccineus TaxID=3886 RepID=A0AAN9NGG7_PHACN